MTKKIEDLPVNQEIVENRLQAVLDERRRPYREVELSYNNIEFGRLRVDIWLEEALKNPEIETSFWEIKDQLEYFKELIESGIRINSDNEQNILRAQVVVQGLYLTDPLKETYLSMSSPLTEIGSYVFIDEDAIFDLIKAEGPRILANPDVQARLMEWLDDADVAKSKMKKLGSALGSYKQAVPRAKRGRAEFSLIKRLGESGTIRNIYKILARYLRYIKDFYNPKYGKNRKPSRLREDFEELVFYALEKESHFNKNVEHQPTRSRHYHFVRTILAFIQNNKHIRREFVALRWEPNRMAKLVLAQALRVSVSKIEKAVPRRLEA